MRTRCIYEGREWWNEEVYRAVRRSGDRRKKKKVGTHWGHQAEIWKLGLESSVQGNRGCAAIEGRQGRCPQDIASRCWFRLYMWFEEISIQNTTIHIDCWALAAFSQYDWDKHFAYSGELLLGRLLSRRLQTTVQSQRPMAGWVLSSKLIVEQLNCMRRSRIIKY